MTMLKGSDMVTVEIMPLPQAFTGRGLEKSGSCPSYPHSVRTVAEHTFSLQWHMLRTTRNQEAQNEISIEGFYILLITWAYPCSVTSPTAAPFEGLTKSRSKSSP